MMDQVKEMFQNRKSYTEKKILELEEQIVRHKSGHRHLEENVRKETHMHKFLLLN